MYGMNPLKNVSTPIGTASGSPRIVSIRNWQRTRFLQGDVEAAVRELKAQDGRDLLSQGSGALVRWLLERDLLDEVALIVYPVVVGDGLRLFPDRGPSHTMELVESVATPAGITIQTFRPAGRAKFGRVDD